VSRLRVLWLVNNKLPELSKLKNEKTNISGGWLVESSRILAEHKSIDLSVAYPCDNHESENSIDGKSITYYSFKKIKNLKVNNITINRYSSAFINLLDLVKPDIVHIHGSELPHTLLMIIACHERRIKTVMSLQGIVSKIKNHLFLGIPTEVIYRNTLRNLIRKDSLANLKRLYQKLGCNEIEAIKLSDAIIGRTTWDLACVKEIDVSKQYFSNNETLRNSFYNSKWTYNDCEKKSIFVSQAHYSLKGLHILLEAMPLIMKQYPNVKVVIGGKNILSNNSLKEKLMQTAYSRYLLKLIKTYKLEDKLILTGPLTESEMCEQFLKANVFVMPSLIENSPNSLCEAMILGVPSVASYVGGIPDFIKHGESGMMYQPDAPYMLAHNICILFSNVDLAVEISSNARKRAKVMFDRKLNSDKLIDIYAEVLNRS